MSTTVERPKAPEQRTVDVDVESLDTRGRTVHGYAVVYNVLSEDLGGYKEQIAPGAFAGVLDTDVRALMNHDPNEVLGRTKSGTLRLHDEERGLRFELDLPDSPSGENVRTAISRGDIDGASFRFDVGTEDWSGDVRTVKTVKALHDVSIGTYPAYPAASIELRTRPPKEETPMEEVATLEPEAEDNEGAEERTSNGGGLRVADINQGGAERRTLLGHFRHGGWKPGRRTEISWDEFEQATESRALTVTGGANPINVLHRDAGGFGADQRYAWPAFPRVSVDAATTSVDVLTQTARTLPAPAARAIDSVVDKPEVASTVAVVTVPLGQVAAVESGVPNIYLLQDQIESIIGTDLRLAVNENLDDLVLDAIAASGFEPPGTAILDAIRAAMSTIQAAGYNPDTLILDPATAETLDTLKTAGPELIYVFGPARLAPATVYGMSVRISKTIPAPAVVDAQAFGRMYMSPVSLQTFEENAGQTNSSTVRMELHAAFGTERQAAAVRIAAAAGTAARSAKK
jgi:Escherichia/Staphylococcus phage prohead protease